MKKLLYIVVCLLAAQACYASSFDRTKIRDVSFNNRMVRITTANEMKVIESNAATTNLILATTNAELVSINAAITTISDVVSGNLARVSVVEALPTGDRTIGRVKITDGTTIASIQASTGFLNIHEADSHFKLINEHFRNRTGTMQNLAAVAVTGSSEITTNPGATFAVNDRIAIWEGARREVDVFKILSITSGGITLDKSLDNSYTTGALIELVDIDLTHEEFASVPSPTIYEIGPTGNEIWHVKRILIYMEGATNPTDENWSATNAPLTNGLMVKQADGVTRNLAIWRSNGDLVEDMYDIDYTEFSVRGRWTFGKVEVAIRLDASDGDKLLLFVQDDLSGSTEIEIKAQGHVEE